MRSLAIMVFAVLLWTQAHGQQMTMRRDGAWLRDGIGLYQRLGAHEKLSQQEAGQAQVVASYVCAVVDLEKYLIFRAYLLNGAVLEARDENHMGPQELKGIGEALPLLLPLMKTRFFQDNPSCEKVFLMVRDFLLEYPELLVGEAGSVIEGALLRAYPETAEP